MCSGTDVLKKFNKRDPSILSNIAQEKPYRGSNAFLIINIYTFPLKFVIKYRIEDNSKAIEKGHNNFGVVQPCLRQPLGSALKLHLYWINLNNTIVLHALFIRKL